MCTPSRSRRRCGPRARARALHAPLPWPPVAGPLAPAPQGATGPKGAQGPQGETGPPADNQETYEILDEVFFSDPITGTYDGILGRLELVDKWQVPPEYVLSEYLDNVLRLPDEFETLEYYMSSVIQELEIKMTDNTIAGLRQLDIELTDKTQRNGARMEELDKKTKDNVLLLQSRIEANLNKIDTNAKDVTSYVDTQIDALDAKMQKHVAAEIAKLGGNGQSDPKEIRTLGTLSGSWCCDGDKTTLYFTTAWDGTGDPLDDSPAQVVQVNDVVCVPGRGHYTVVGSYSNAHTDGVDIDTGAWT